MVLIGHMQPLGAMKDRRRWLARKRGQTHKAQTPNTASLSAFAKADSEHILADQRYRMVMMHSSCTAGAKFSKSQGVKGVLETIRGIVSALNGLCPGLGGAAKCGLFNKKSERLRGRGVCVRRPEGAPSNKWPAFGQTDLTGFPPAPRHSKATWVLSYEFARG